MSGQNVTVNPGHRGHGPGLGKAGVEGITHEVLGSCVHSSADSL